MYKIINFIKQEYTDKNYSFSYTELNILLIIASIIIKLGSLLINYHNIYIDSLFPILLINSFAILVSFHSSYFLDNNCFKKISNKKKLSYKQFHITNILIHLLPVIGLFIYYLYTEKILLFGIYTGCISLFIHISWMILYVKSYNLSKIYIYLEDYKWKILWIITIISHILGGFILYYI